MSLTMLLLVSVAFGLLSYSLAHDIDVSLQSIAEVMATKSAPNSRTQIPPNLDELFQRFFGFSPSTRYFEMLNPQGNQESNNLPSHSELIVSPEALQDAMRGIITFKTLKTHAPYPIRVMIMPILENDCVTNIVQVGISLENLYKTRRKFILIMAAILPLGLLLAGGGGWLLARRALMPVDRMTQAVRRISSEHLQERLPEIGTGDELDRLAGTLNAMLIRLEDSFHQIRQFSADASHELQTPITILKGEIEVALRLPRTSQEYQRVLRSSLEEIDRISRLVAGLLLLARADAGVLRLDLQKVDLNELVSEVLARLRVLANEKSISLRYDGYEPLFIQGDKEHLQRLLLNLIDNAIKYTHPGGSVSVLLSCEDSRHARISITDTGIGLSREEQNQVFKCFYRASEARSQYGGGAGLGLCIAQSIAVAHGGSIEIDSTPGQGSTFTVVLPAACPSLSMVG
jgi:heavy metal sensor kinase